MKEKSLNGKSQYPLKTANLSNVASSKRGSLHVTSNVKCF